MTQQLKTGDTVQWEGATFVFLLTKKATPLLYQCAGCGNGIMEGFNVNLWREQPKTTYESDRYFSWCDPCQSEVVSQSEVRHA